MLLGLFIINSKLYNIIYYMSMLYVFGVYGIGEHGAEVVLPALSPVLVVVIIPDVSR